MIIYYHIIIPGEPFLPKTKRLRQGYRPHQAYNMSENPRSVFLAGKQTHILLYYRILAYISVYYSRLTPGDLIMVTLGQESYCSSKLWLPRQIQHVPWQIICWLFNYREINQLQNNLDSEKSTLEISLVTFLLANECWGKTHKLIPRSIRSFW